MDEELSSGRSISPKRESPSGKRKTNNQDNFWWWFNPDRDWTKGKPKSKRKNNETNHD